MKKNLLTGFALGIILMLLALPAYAVEPTWDYVVIPHGSNAADFFGGGVGASADNTRLTG